MVGDGIISVISAFVRETGYHQKQTKHDIMVYDDTIFIAMICVRDDRLHFVLAGHESNVYHRRLEYHMVSLESISDMLDYYKDLRYRDNVMRVR